MKSEGELSGDGVLGFVFGALAIEVIVTGAIFYNWISSDLPAKPPPIAFRVDINSADSATLELLPGVGPAMAQRIIAERERGPFKNVEDLQRIRGIAETRARRMAPYLVFGKSVEPGEAAETP